MIDWNYVFALIGAVLMGYFAQTILSLIRASLDYDKRIAEGRAELERIKREIAEGKARMSAVMYWQLSPTLAVLGGGSTP